MKRSILVSFIFIVLIVVFLAGCSDDHEASGESGSNMTSDSDSEEVENEADENNQEEWPEELVYAIIPTEDQEEIISRHEVFAEYLSDRIGIPVTIFSGTDYNANIEAMRNDHVQIAYYGPFSYLLAKERAGAEPFAVHLKTPEDEAFYTSQFITLEGNGIESFEDLEGKSFAWVDPTSTSGNLFPRSHLINELSLTEDGVDDFLGATIFSGSHESSVLSVLNGDVEAAAISSGSGVRAIEQYADHRNGEKLFTFGETMDIPSAPYTYKETLPEDLKELIREAFYDALEEPALETYLQDAAMEGGFIPVTHENYEVIEMTASALNMSPEDLLGE
ncbi:phosphate/phosphite/phosphonate ABC transporter substrate-binding protein [Evansella halocellulosilytica]|uniref:phosphate/phosphite/phosphonate ABC transporter substrate-binding protein n=1 Tax=Evansella halocellulosilytica TaxID=2011013 RepID=UPI000BB91B76|nr:phosphate/phosphite/phosphonate ABC transporter substrate-binding protein [Evansella halocellulosilytica]